MVYFFNTSFRIGGPARVCNLWATALKNEKIESIFVALNDKTNTFGSVKVLCLKINSSNFILIFLKLFFFLKSNKGQAFIFNKGFFIAPLFFIKLIFKNLNFIYYIHGGSKDFKTHYGNLKSYMIYKTFNSVVCLHDNYDDDVDYFVSKTFFRVTSDFIFSNFYKKIKISYIPNPLSFQNPNKIFRKKNIILAAGRLDKIKGFDLLIDRFSENKKILKNWKLNIAGDGDEYNSLLNKIKSKKLEGKVNLLGGVTDMSKLYEESKIFIMSSHYEGFGMVTLEAMQFGLPIISNINDGSKLLVKDSFNGFIFDFNDQGLFSKILFKIINNEALLTEMGKNSCVESSKYKAKNHIASWKKILIIN
jgi:glycosyltransferase involved in cell wall biosynthesis